MHTRLAVDASCQLGIQLGQPGVQLGQVYLLEPLPVAQSPEHGGLKVAGLLVESLQKQVTQEDGVGTARPLQTLPWRSSVIPLLPCHGYR